MDNLLLRPEIQSAIIPLLVATVVAWAARPAGAAGSWPGTVAGFTVAAWLITGLRLTPLNATRTILVLFWLAVVVGLVVDLTGRTRPARRWLWPLLALIGVVWVFFNVLTRAEPPAMAAIAVGGVVYAWWMVAATEALPGPPVRHHAVLFGAALATGIACVLGTSALLGQLGMALGLAAGSGLLLGLFGVRIASTCALRVPVMLATALLGLGGVVLATLPWYCLIPLAAVPIVVRWLALPSSRPAAVLVATLAALVPGAVAVALAWSALDPSSYGYVG